MGYVMNWLTSPNSEWKWKKVFGTRFYKLWHPSLTVPLVFGVVDDMGNIVLVDV